MTPPEDVFRVTLDAAISSMLDGLEARGYRVPRFAFAFDAELPDGTPIHGERVTGYTGEEGATALAQAAARVLQASG